jgi:recombination protein RecA
VTKQVRNIRADQKDQLVSQMQRSFGQTAVKKGGLQRALRSIPTGSLALDYELGTGGWPMGYLTGVFGPRDIGKSSMIGFNAIKQAMKMGMNCAWIAAGENAGDENWEAWARQNDVDVDELLLAWPETGEEAFEMLHKFAKSGVVDLIIFDSIGAILGEGEMKDDGKARQGGQASLITWGVKRVAPVAFKNEVAVILLNQVRHNMSAGHKGVVYKQPGGEGLEHMEAVIVQLKRGKERFTVKDNGTDVQVGNEIVADIRRNKLAEGTGRRAVFNYFYAETEEYPFGIDTDADTLNTAVRCGVIEKAGSYYKLPDNTSHQGVAKAGEHLRANPALMEQVREAVLARMLERNANPKAVLEVVNGD